MEIDRYRLAIREAGSTLSLNSISNEIQLKQKQLDKIFDSYKLYSNRWFLILHLRQGGCSHHVILLSDRFYSMTEYLSFRHQIKRMAQTHNVN